MWALDALRPRGQSTAIKKKLACFFSVIGNRPGAGRALESTVMNICFFLTYFIFLVLPLEIGQALDALISLPLEPGCSIAVVNDAVVGYARLD